jgi:hypothetical protein
MHIQLDILIAWMQPRASVTRGAAPA